MAGAIYVKTNDPIYDYEAAVRAIGGDDDRYGGAVMANLPIVDQQFALRLAGEYDRFESDIHYPLYRDFDRYDDLVEDEQLPSAAKALIEPKGIPEFRAVLTYAYSEDRPTPMDIAGPLLGFDFDDDRGDFNPPMFTEVRQTNVHNGGAEITYDISSDFVFTAQSAYSHSDTNRPSVNRRDR